MAKYRTALVLDKQVAASVHYKAGEWAELLGLEARALRHGCHLTFQCSPQKLLDYYRLEASKPLLLTRLLVKQVAAELGYRQVTHFCRQFKQSYGLTPTAFVAQYLQA